MESLFAIIMLIWSFALLVIVVSSTDKRYIYRIVLGAFGIILCVFVYNSGTDLITFLSPKNLGTNLAHIFTRISGQPLLRITEDITDIPDIELPSEVYNFHAQGFTNTIPELLNPVCTLRYEHPARGFNQAVLLMMKESGQQSGLYSVTPLYHGNNNRILACDFIMHKHPNAMDQRDVESFVQVVRYFRVGSSSDPYREAAMAYIRANNIEPV